MCSSSNFASPLLKQATEAYTFNYNVLIMEIFFFTVSQLFMDMCNQIINLTIIILKFTFIVIFI